MKHANKLKRYPDHLKVYDGRRWCGYIAIQGIRLRRDYYGGVGRRTLVIDPLPKSAYPMFSLNPIVKNSIELNKKYPIKLLLP